MTYEHGTNQLDEEVILNDITYQVNGEYTNLLDEETDGRSNVIVSDESIRFEVELVFFGDDFELPLTDQNTLRELETELYNLL
jgi:hypothetical protein